MERRALSPAELGTAGIGIPALHAEGIKLGIAHLRQYVLG